MTDAIARLLNPRHIAVIGASADPAKLTGRPIAYLQKYGFTGTIYPVNPRADTIAGLTCYPSAAALPVAPDVALVLVGPDRATQAVQDLAERGTAAAVVLAGGYGEAGEAGIERQHALRRAAGGMRLLGPNTIGLVNITDRVMLSASGALEVGALTPGSISVVSQSGGILGSLLSRAADRGIGFAKLVSTGNEADLDTADLLEVLVEDPATTVLAVYMEGLRRPAAFRAVARRAAELGKPIVVFKVGRSESGARSAVSHTGALAGVDRMFDALFKQLGVVRALDFSDLLDIPAALATGRRASGRRVGILTSTGGAGTLVADSCGLAELDVALPDAATAHRLATLLDGDQASASRNPVDVTLAGLRPELFRSALSALLDSPGYDAAVVVVGSSAIAQPTLVADVAVECQARSAKPIVAYVSPHAPEVVRLLNARGIVALTTPESCATVLDALARPSLQRTGAKPALPAAPTELPDLPVLPSGPLNEAESRAVFALFGVPSVREIVAADPALAQAAAAELGSTVVVKILSRTIAHKTEIGGVRVGVAQAEIGRVCEAMQARLGPAIEGFMVQEMVTGGVEMILGLTRDPQLGLAVLLGMGGTLAELYDDTALRLLPITRQDAGDMIRELKAARVLDGYRGAARRDGAALIDAIMAFAAMGERLGDRLLEAEINPLFVLDSGQGVVAADGLLILA